MSYDIQANKRGTYLLPTKGTRLNDDIRFIADISDWGNLKAFQGSFSIGYTGNIETYTLNLGFELPERFFLTASCFDTSTSASGPFNFFKFERNFDEKNYGTATTPAGGVAQRVEYENAITVSADRQSIIFSSVGHSYSYFQYIRLGNWSWTIII